MYGVRVTRFIITILCALGFYLVGAAFNADTIVPSGPAGYFMGIIIASLFYEIQLARAAKGAFAKSLLSIDRWFQQLFGRWTIVRIIARGLCFLILYYEINYPSAPTIFSISYLTKRLVVDGVVVIFFGLAMELMLPKPPLDKSPANNR